MEFGDQSEQLVSVMAQIADSQVFGWDHAVWYIEGHAGRLLSSAEAAQVAERLKGAQTALAGLEQIADRLCRMMPQLPAQTKEMLHACLVAIRGAELLQKIGVWIGAGEFGAEPVIAVDGKRLAAELEEWFLFYKEVWRSVSRESELYRIQDVVFGYADLLRG